MQQISLTVEKIIRNIQADIEGEIVAMKNNDVKSAIPIINFAKFIGESGINLGLVSTKVMTNWLTFLSEQGDTIALTATLRLCGLPYKLNNPEHFKNLRQSLGIFGSEVDEEIEKIINAVDIDDIDDLTEHLQSRYFKPADGARVIEDLEVFLSDISQDKNDEYNYQNLYDFRNVHSVIARKPFLREMLKPDANVIKLAQFLKILHNIIVRIVMFIRSLKIHLNHKIAEMPIDRPEEMIRVGKLIVELRNMTVTDKLPQDKWLDMIESLEPEKNCNILQIQLEVLKVMMYNLYLFEDDKYVKYLKYIMSIDTSDPKYPKKIHSIILQITQNLFHKKISKSSKSISFRIKSGWKVDSLPYDIPQTSPIDFDLDDFVKLFFINATMNKFLMENSLKSMKFLTRGSRGQKFNKLLYSLSMDRYKNILKPDYFDEDDAIGTLRFILNFYPENIFRQHSLTTFFTDLLNFEDFDDHKNCFKILIRMIKEHVMFKDFLRQKDHDSKVFKLFRKIQQKLKDVEYSVADENVEIEIWHIVDYQGSSKSEPSLLAWSFTEHYQENQQKRQEVLENLKKTPQKIDNLAQNLKDFTRNFHKIQQQGSSSTAPNSTENDQKSMQNPANNQIKESKSYQKTQFKIQILPENPQSPSQYPSHSQTNRNFGRRQTNSKIEWNVSRDNLKDRKDLQNADSKIFRK